MEDQDDDEKADGEVLNGKMMISKFDGEAMAEDEEASTKEMMKLNLPRQFRTNEDDYQEHGYSRGRVQVDSGGDCEAEAH